MVTDSCACCGRADGDLVDEETVTRLRQVRVISRFALVGEGEEATITMCVRCASLMPLDVDGLVAEVNQHVDARTADDALLEAFLRRYLTEVWPEDRAPSTQQLCNLLNSVRVTTPRGAKWEYHNLNQRLARLGLDKDRVVAGRAKSTFHDRLSGLLEASVGWTAAEAAEARAAAASAGAADGLDTAVDPTWSPPEPLPLPADMPGAGGETQDGEAARARAGYAGY